MPPAFNREKTVRCSLYTANEITRHVFSFHEPKAIHLKLFFLDTRMSVVVSRGSELVFDNLSLKTFL